MVVDLLGMLEETVSNWARLGHHALLERFVLRNGVLVAGNALPSGYKRGQMKECFSNSANAALADFSLTYYEGLAVSSSLPMPIHHAWCVQEGGGIVDLTWADPSDCVYMGIAVPLATLCEELQTNGVYGVLDTGRGLNSSYMFGADPELAEVFKRVAGTHRTLFPL